MNGALLLSIALLANAPQASQVDRWEQLYAIADSAMVRVTVAASWGADQVVGRFVTADAAAISVSGDGQVRVIRRDTVMRVDAQRPRHPIRKGFNIGAAAGLLQSVVALKGFDPVWTPFLTFGWGAVGAIGGGVVSTLTSPEYDVVFVRTPSL